MKARGPDAQHITGHIAQQTANFFGDFQTKNACNIPWNMVSYHCSGGTAQTGTSVRGKPNGPQNGRRKNGKSDTMKHQPKFKPEIFRLAVALTARMNYPELVTVDLMGNDISDLPF